MKKLKNPAIIACVLLCGALAFLVSCPNGNDGPKKGKKTLTGIEVTTLPTKLQYNLNEPFNPAGMVITAVYSDNSTAAVTDYGTSGFSSSVQGNQTITVTYQEFTVTFTVRVRDPGKQDVATPVADPEAGEIYKDTPITLSVTTADAEIWYTTNGSTPTAGAPSVKYTTPIAPASVTVKAVAVKDGMNDSDILVATYTVGLRWVWELADDKNQTKFAAGISELHGYEEHPTKYSQSFVLEDPYVRGQPETGWYKKEMVPFTALNGYQGEVEKVVMQDARGFYFDPTLSPAEQTIYWPANKEAGDLIKMKVPTKAKTIGPDGRTEIEAFHFWGTLLQRGSESDNPDEWAQRRGPRSAGQGGSSGQPLVGDQDYRLGCGWPAITLYATPPDIDEDPAQITRWALLDGYGYTFWVRADKQYRSYRSLVENWEYRPNEGHDPGHWYGPVPGRDGTPGLNYTPAQVGEWKQVTVIYDSQHPRFNLDVPNWTMMYDIQTNYPGDKEPSTIMENHDKDHSMRISFSFMLQFNGGNEGNDWVEYSVDTGKHEFDVWIYGLEILQY